VVGFANFIRSHLAGAAGEKVMFWGDAGSERNPEKNSVAPSNVFRCPLSM
jgi:hypothetical protein